MKVIFDTETNGLHEGVSVLNFSAVILNDGKVSVIDRYYLRLRNEPIDHQALKINGLYDEVIRKIREKQNAKYPIYFKDDKDIPKILNKAEVLIAHNIEFDLKHIQYWHYNDLDLEGKELFDTMLVLKEVKNLNQRPSLKKSINLLNIDINKIKDFMKKHNLNNTSFHSALFDSFCTFAIYKKLNSIAKL